jgi:hypothetical protein
MVSFADILRKASKRLYHTKAEPLDLISKSALELDAELKQWKDQLPSILSLDVTSLQDPKWLNKQKVVLKLSKFAACLLVVNVSKMDAYH